MDCGEGVLACGSISDIVCSPAGGYRLSNHWKILSGITFANWFVTFGIVSKDGEPRLTAAGAPEVRLFAVHRDQLRIENTGNVSGMRATGSNDVVVADAFIPAMLVSSVDFPSRIDRPLYRGFLPALAFPGCAAVVLGVARATIDEAASVAVDKAAGAGGRLRIPVALST